MRGRSETPWSTRVVVGTGLLPRAARSIAARAGAGLVAVVSDARVARRLAPAFLKLLAGRGVRPTLLTFPAGERAKTRETKARLEDRLATAGAGRDALVVAFGGGVTGDLAGFLAATWHRGVPVVQIPTSLLAMVDAALGGKTGVDVPAGKNLVGAFHPPCELWADVQLLRTLPDRHFRCGLAEAVKIAAAVDVGFFADIERLAARLRDRDERAVIAVVARCLALKGRVVARDARDRGPRAALNFGHTVAHALEAATRYRVPHGEAVAIGLVAEARIAERLTGFPAASTERIERLLRGLGLPTRLPRGVEPRDLVPFARRDKKAREGAIRCALPGRLGGMARVADSTLVVDAAREFVPSFRRD